MGNQYSKMLNLLTDLKKNAFFTFYRNHCFCSWASYATVVVEDIIEDFQKKCIV